MHIFGPFLQLKYRRKGLKVNMSRYLYLCSFICLFSDLSPRAYYRGKEGWDPRVQHLCVGRHWELGEEHKREWEQRKVTGAPWHCVHRDCRSHPLPLLHLLHSLDGGCWDQRKNSIRGLRKINDKFCLKSEFVRRKDEACGSSWRGGAVLGTGKHRSAA